MKTDICFIGHSHIAEIYTNDYDSMDSYNNSLSTKLTDGKEYIINPGSVGQPRDLDWRLSFGIFDTKTMEFEFVRSEYDVKAAAQKILAANLPKYLADRILVGR
jgi:diadenosine tetraphosphatase ApaH/serine/threonine PP2A family protein phosphatase